MAGHAKKKTSKPQRARASKKPAASAKARTVANKKPSKPAGAKTPVAKPTVKAKGKTPARPVAGAKGTSPAKAAPAMKAATDGVAPKVEAAASGTDKKAGPKGITIVQPRPVRKSRPKPKFEMPKSEPLIKPGGKWKPLIPSGPKAPPIGVMGGQDQTHLPPEQRVKSKLTKRELEQYRVMLRRKRSELVGDISNMEDEALRQTSGSLSHLPQHMAEQGTDTYDQGLSLDLAAVDRNLLREIEDALKRIEAGTYGICERTGTPIKPDRLHEIPWARYSIEAAREMERRPYQE